LVTSERISVLAEAATPDRALEGGFIRPRRTVNPLSFLTNWATSRISTSVAAARS
jgi:hypothetical protein